MPSLNNKHTILFIASIALLGVVSVSPRAQAPASTTVPTFTHDIAPILYTNCVECHRAGEIAPMSLITYAEVRPWAKGIVAQVSNGVMPPWHADAPHGTFRNERGLTAAQKDLIERWAAAGAPEGNPTDLPPAPAFTSGWGIGQPDAIFEMQEDYPVPANGTIEYEHFYIPTNFTEEKWLQAIEARPGNRALVHHVLVYYEAPPDGPRTPPVLQPNRDRQPHRGRARQGNRPPRDAGSPHASARHIRAGHEAAGVSRGHSAAAARLAACCICRCTTPPTARRHRSQQGRADVREGAAPREMRAIAVPQRAGSRFRRAPSTSRSTRT